MGYMFETNKRKLRIFKRPRYATNARKGIKGGVSMICTRYGKSNNPFKQKEIEKEDSEKEKAVTMIKQNPLNILFT